MKNITKKAVLATAITLALASSQGSAQVSGFSAVVDSRLTYDDNILRTADEFSESDTSVVIAPELTLAGVLGKQRFSISYAGEYANYFDNSDVNYDDHDIRLRADLDHSNRLTSRFGLQYADKHEDFQDTSIIFNGLNEFNHYTQTQLDGRLAYGRQDSFGQLVFGLSRTERDYDNNDQEFRSYDRNLASLAFYYRVAPRTRILAEVVYQDYEYNPDVGFTDLDNEYIRYQVGVEWALTNQLEGTVKVGYQDRDYKLDNLQDIDGLAYEASIDYKPNTYTTINATARRESIDSSINTAGGFLRTTYGLGVKHGLTELLSVEGELGYVTDDLVFNVNREDKRYSAKAGLDYSVLSWVDVGVNYTYNERNSTLDIAEFKSNSINLTLKVALD